MKDTVMLLPYRTTHRPGEAVGIELAPADAPRILRVEHLGVEIAALPVPAGAGEVRLPDLPEGGYAVTLHDGAGTPLAQTAVEVLAEPVSRLRYGFVANFAPDRPLDGVLRNFRRLHLSGAQFYDWAYRHADLIGPQEYADPLGQPVSLGTVRRLTGAFRAAGTAPLGYAAVYGVGKQEWPDWEQLALLRPDGTPYTLGDFLNLVDPGDERWQRHFTADLRRATDLLGFAGFHLDQYGWPHRALRTDGRTVDLAQSFDSLIRAVRAELPEATLVFNNVNDFPAWVTARSPQDVTYTEVWQPHDTLADLAAVATRARTLAPDRPAVFAAYQTVYGTYPAHVAELTNRFTMATAFSHGATQLLAGEAGSVLVDPYYVRNHPAEASTLDLLARWYDLLVAAGDLLLDPAVADVTRSVAGAFNDEVDVVGGDGVVLSHEARPGVVWRRVVHTPHGTVLHLINLTGQDDTGWDTPKNPVTPVTGLRVRARQHTRDAPVVRVADPDRGVRFAPLDARVDGEHLSADLPDLHVWQIVFLPH